MRKKTHLGACFCFLTELKKTTYDEKKKYKEQNYLKRNCSM